jgi:hypothetical protein
VPSSSALVTWWWADVLPNIPTVRALDHASAALERMMIDA